MTHEEIEALLTEEIDRLHPMHRDRFQAMRVPFRTVPVAAQPGESVVVVAEHAGKILYWSDVEDGWELELPTSEGGIEDRGCNQFELSHIMWQALGDPEQMV